MHSKLRKNIAFLFTIIFAILLSTIASGSAFAENGEPQEVYLGGFPVGIIAKSDGLVVTELINVSTKDGSYSPALQSGIRRGDLIMSVNGTHVKTANELNEIIQKSDNTISMTVRRGNETFSVSVQPMFDLVHNALKIGISVQDRIAGIGTITYVTEANEYGALGHPIGDSFGNDAYRSGALYPCSVTGYKRADRIAAGELLGNIHLSEKPIATIDKNFFCGIFGSFYASPERKGRKIEVAKRRDAVPGKAYIYTSIDENGPRAYEIQIVKTYHQNKPAEKGMVIRVVDKVLLKTTGGILQGMSGSPIIQKNKLVGAVTHVFTNETTMGYGIYADWMVLRQS